MNQRKKGNEAVYVQDFSKALKLYCFALFFEPLDPVLLSNRSLCFLKLNQREEALTDAKSVVQLRPNWHKGACA
jgi:hypothetical protein